MGDKVRLAFRQEDVADALEVRVSRDGIRANMYLKRDFVVFPEQRKVVKTGLHFDIPDGMMGLVVSDGTLSREKGVVVAGGTKIIAPHYFQELVVTLQNLGRDTARMETGERLFSLLLVPCPAIELVEANPRLSWMADRD